MDKDTPKEILEDVITYGSETVNSQREDSEEEKKSFNEIDIDCWNEIELKVKTQLDTSRQFKMPRMRQIKENEDLYLGVVEKEYKNPFNYSFPYMSGFVDQLFADLDEPPIVSYEPGHEAQYRKSQKLKALFDKLSHSKLPHASWEYKDRAAKKLAIFSGVGILKFHVERDGEELRAVLNNVDHYDFHCEPGGGGILENHLFLGEEGIYKTREQIEKGAIDGLYFKEKTETVINRTNADEYKDNSAGVNDDRLNRYRAMGLDPTTNSYVGQDIYQLIEWYLTYKGERYYALYDEYTTTAIRIEKLRDMISVVEPGGDALWPYVAFHTNEDPKVFWTKGPCDDVRDIAKAINKLLNQALYNREKQNTGHRLYDPEMVTDVKSLSDWRVDALTPVDTRNGTRSPSMAVHRIDTGVIEGTENFVEFLNNFVGQKVGSTPGSQGQAPSQQKVGIFYGEMEQISKRLSVYNKSYRDMWAGIGLRFRVGVTDNIKGLKLKVELMGAKGAEWSEIVEDDLQGLEDCDIIVTGGSETENQKIRENNQKIQVLQGLQTVNPKWIEMQKLKMAGYTDEEIKDAFGVVDPGLREILSEAAQAEIDIVEGKTPELNRGANTAFIQHLLDFAESLTMEDKEKENEIAIRVIQYAESHAIIAAENEARSAVEMINQFKIKKAELGEVTADIEQPTPQPSDIVPQPQVPTAPNPAEYDFQANPTGASTAISQEISRSVTPEMV